MKDLIRSPLQFIRPMTQSEWQELVLRAAHRERLRNLRRQRKLGNSKVQAVKPARRHFTRNASSASL